MKKISAVLILCVTLSGCKNEMQPAEKMEVFEAVERGDTDILRKYLNRGMDPNLHGSQGSLLGTAVRSPNIETLKMLIAAGADVNRKTPDATGLLLDAVLFGKCEQAILLLTAGGDVEERFVNYWRAALPAEYKNKTVSELYFRYKRKSSVAWERNEICWNEWEKMLQKYEQKKVQ